MGIGSLLVFGICAAVLPPRLMAADEPEKPEKPEIIRQDRTRMEKELADLESQREKLTEKIRAIKRKMGAPEIMIRRGGGNGELTPEVRVEVERALESAHKATREALKSIPDMKGLHERILAIPDMKDLHDKIMKIYVEPDGKVHKFDSSMSAEEKAKFEKEMQSLRAKFKDREFLMAPRVRAFGDGGGNSDLRAEMDKLRAEMQRMREEFRRSKESKPINDSDIL